MSRFSKQLNLSINLAVGLLLAGAAISQAKVGPPSQSDVGKVKAAAKVGLSDDAQIRAQAKEYSQAFQTGDLKKIMSMWSEDASYIGPDGKLEQGKPALEKLYADFFNAGGAKSFDLQIDSLSFPTANTAMERGRSSLTDKSGTRYLADYQALHIKRNGVWLMNNVIERLRATSSEKPPIDTLSWLLGKWEVEGKQGKLNVEVSWAVDHKILQCKTSFSGAVGVPHVETEYIYWSPSRQRLCSWQYNTAGGVSEGCWVPETGAKNEIWSIQATSVEPDGMSSSAKYFLSKKPNGDLGWRSVNRRLGGRLLPDTSEVFLKRVGR